MIAANPLDFCQVVNDGEPCGVYSDDHDGVCVICKAQGKTIDSPATDETFGECPPWDGAEPGY